MHSLHTCPVTAAVFYSSSPNTRVFRHGIHACDYKNVLLEKPGKGSDEHEVSGKLSVNQILQK